jgi:hypothetical protein
MISEQSCLQEATSIPRRTQTMFSAHQPLFRQFRHNLPWLRIIQIQTQELSPTEWENSGESFQQAAAPDSEIPNLSDSKSTEWTKPQTTDTNEVVDLPAGKPQVVEHGFWNWEEI